MSDQEHLVIRTALSSIHSHGFVHNDIHQNTILIKLNGSQVSHAFFIDFAFSKLGSWYNFRDEMKTLSSLFGTTTKPPQQVSKNFWRPSAATLKGCSTSIDQIYRAQSSSSTLGLRKCLCLGYLPKARATQMKSLARLLRRL